jgi:precorrin-6x reductase
MMTALGALLQERVEATSLRAGAVKRVIAGGIVTVETLEAVATYLNMPNSEVFRLAGSNNIQELDDASQLIRDMMYMLDDEVRQRVEEEFISKLKIELKFMLSSRNNKG